MFAGLVNFLLAVAYLRRRSGFWFENPGRRKRPIHSCRGNRAGARRGSRRQESIFCREDGPSDRLVAGRSDQSHELNRAGLVGAIIALEMFVPLRL